MDFSQRRLPHIHAIGQPIFVTFRLYGSLPVGREFPKESMTSGEAFVAMDRLLDTARFGPIHLQRPEMAAWSAVLFSTVAKRAAICMPG
jgi:hypothetical protein